MKWWFLSSLPSCVVNAVRDIYPDDTYTGFRKRSPIFHRNRNLKTISKSVPLRHPVTSSSVPLKHPVFSSSVSFQSPESSTCVPVHHPVASTSTPVHRPVSSGLEATDSATLQTSAYSIKVPLHLPVALETDTPQHTDTFQPASPVKSSLSCCVTNTESYSDVAYTGFGESEMSPVSPGKTHPKKVRKN